MTVEGSRTSSHSRPARSRRGLAALVALLAAGCTTYAPRTPVERASQWQRAREASADERWDLAASLWNEIRLGTPNAGTEPHIETSTALVELGRHQDALAILDNATQIYSVDGEVLRRRALLLDAMGFERAAEADLLRALEIRPDCPLTWSDLGQVQLELSEPSDAAESLEHAIALAGEETPELLLRCARANRMAGQLDLAEQRYGRLVDEHGPASPETLVEAASLYTDCDPSRAPRAYLNRSMGWIDSVTEADPQAVEAHFVRGLLLEQLGNPVDALTAYERTAELDNLHLGALNNMALLYLRLHRPDRAANILDRAIELERDPRRVRSLQQLRAEALAQAGSR